jgi:hypothetical protein
MLDVGQFKKQKIQIVFNDTFYKDWAVSYGWILLAQG